MLQPNFYQLPEDGLPPQEVRIIDLRPEPWPDQGRRVRVHLSLTPFRERPDIHVKIADPAGEEVSSISIIESIEAKMAFTMHIRSPEVKGQYLLTASLVYPEIGQVDQKQVSFETYENNE